MKKKYILVLTFLFMLCGQMSFGSEPFGGDFEDLPNSLTVVGDWGNETQPGVIDSWTGDNGHDYLLIEKDDGSLKIVESYLNDDKEIEFIAYKSHSTDNSTESDFIINNPNDELDFCALFPEFCEIFGSSGSSETPFTIGDSGAYGWNDGSAEAFWNKYVPITSSFHNFYSGINNGDLSQAAWGAGMFFVDIASLGFEGLAVRVGDIGLATVMPRTALTLETAAKFENSIYNTINTTTVVTLQRVFGGTDAYLKGAFATTVENATRSELAILDEWGNSMRFEATINIPAGQTLEIGMAAKQTSSNLLQTLPGGAEQVLLPEFWDYQNWVTNVIDKTTGISYTFDAFKAEFPTFITRP